MAGSHTQNSSYLSVPDIAPRGVALAALATGLRDGSIAYEDILRRARNPQQVLLEKAQAQSTIQDLSTLPIRRRQEMTAADQVAQLNEMKIQEARRLSSPAELKRLQEEQDLKRRSDVAAATTAEFKAKPESLQRQLETDIAQLETAKEALKGAQYKNSPAVRTIEEELAKAKLAKEKFDAQPGPGGAAHEKAYLENQSKGYEEYFKKYGTAPRYISVTDSYDFTPPEGWSEPGMVVKPMQNADGSPSKDWVNIDGKPHPARKPTAEENKAREFGVQMGASQKITSAYESVFDEAGNATGRGPKQGSFDPTTANVGSQIKETLGNLPFFGMQNATEGHQSYWNAKQRWIEARLRVASGAAISHPEYRSINTYYFPQPGDKPKVVQEKQRARQLAQEEMDRTGDGPAPAFGALQAEKGSAGATPTTPSAGAPPAPAAGTPPAATPTGPTSKPVSTPTVAAHAQLSPGAVGADSTGSPYIKLGPPGTNGLPITAKAKGTNAPAGEALASVLPGGTNAPSTNLVSNAPQVDAMAPATVPGLIEPGNIDVKSRPVVDLPDGGKGTVLSITVTDKDGTAVLIPTIHEGKVLGDAAAYDLYKKTGQHLGKFKTIAEADNFAKSLSEDQGRRLNLGDLQKSKPAASASKPFKLGPEHLINPNF